MAHATPRRARDAASRTRRRVAHATPRREYDSVLCTVIVCRRFLNATVSAYAPTRSITVYLSHRRACASSGSPRALGHRQRAATWPASIANVAKLATDDRPKATSQKNAHSRPARAPSNLCPPQPVKTLPASAPAASSQKNAHFCPAPLRQHVSSQAAISHSQLLAELAAGPELAARSANLIKMLSSVDSPSSSLTPTS